MLSFWRHMNVWLTAMRLLVGAALISQAFLHSGEIFRPSTFLTRHAEAQVGKFIILRKPGTK
jgi:hypothetical protein